MQLTEAKTTPIKKTTKNQNRNKQTETTKQGIENDATNNTKLKQKTTKNKKGNQKQ